MRSFDQMPIKWPPSQRRRTPTGIPEGNRPEIDLQCGRETHQSFGDAHSWGLIALEALRYVFRET